MRLRDELGMTGAGMFLIVGGVVFAVLIGIFFVARADYRAFASFMDDCTAARPKYECTAMWRDGNQAVVPVFIPMGR